MNTTELIVNDEYCEAMAQYYQRMGNRIETILEDYLSAMNRASAYGIPSGDTADALREFISCAEQLKGDIGEISDLASQYAKNFVSKIDRADRYLY